MTKLTRLAIVAALLFPVFIFSQTPYNGIEAGMSNIYRLSDAKTRSISPENFNGAKGKGGMATEGAGARAARDLGAAGVGDGRRQKNSRRDRGRLIADGDHHSLALGRER